MCYLLIIDNVYKVDFVLLQIWKMTPKKIKCLSDTAKWQKKTCQSVSKHVINRHATVLLNLGFHSCTMGINDSNLAELPGKFEEVIPMGTSLGHRVRDSGGGHTGCKGAPDEVSAEG